MASNFEQRTENDVNNVPPMVSAKAAGEDVTAKKKLAFGDLKNKFINRPENVDGKDEKNILGCIESVFGNKNATATHAASSDPDLDGYHFDEMKGKPVDYEAAWADQWITPLENRMDEWIAAIQRSKEQPMRTPEHLVEDIDFMTQTYSGVYPEPIEPDLELPPPLLDEAWFTEDTTSMDNGSTMNDQLVWPGEHRMHEVSVQYEDPLINEAPLENSPEDKESFNHSTNGFSE